MKEFLTLQEIALEARRKLNPNVWDYLEGGAESETSVKRNRFGLDSIALKPRVLRNVVEIDCSANLFKHETRLPVAIAPCGSVDDLNSGGTLAIARAAEEFNIVSFFSASSPTPPDLEEIATATGHPKVYQLSVRGDPAVIDERVKRAIDAGYTGIGLTLDAIIKGRRERDMVSRHVPSSSSNRVAPLPAATETTLTWDHIKRFKDSYDIPLVLKAIATAEDAVLAVEHGVDVIYVSNHGGRQLDYSRATIDILPDVAEAVGGKAEIMIDGGFLRGTDIIKAIALGAGCVAVGRLMCLGLAADGQAGIVRVMELLESEIKTAMGLMGVTHLGQLDRSYLDEVRPVSPPGMASAYPLLGAIATE
ncbi:MAG: alpha-hydroxy acid oxidase [Rhodospirillales bacterium]|jgi:glycolate oxidase|nr:alpha-hydroxy acid oxidase [Rhodospirillales bacterium]